MLTVLYSVSCNNHKQEHHLCRVAMFKTFMNEIEVGINDDPVELLDSILTHTIFFAAYVLIHLRYAWRHSNLYVYVHAHIHAHP